MKKLKGTLIIFLFIIVYYVIVSFTLYGKVSVNTFIQDKGEKIEYSELFLKVKDLAVNEQTITALSDDPRMEVAISNPKRYVYIDINYIERNGIENDVAQIFWANTGEAFDYERSVKFDLELGQNIIELPSKEYEKLRIDLTSHEGVEIGVTSLKLCSTESLKNLGSFWSTYFGGVICAVLIYLIFLYCKKKQVKLCNYRELKEQAKSIIQLYTEFYNTHKLVIWMSIFVCICIYGYETFNFTLGGDEEREAVLGAFDGKVYGMDVDVSIDNFLLVIGRYGNWLFRKIFMYQGIFTPTYTMLVALVFMLLAVVTWCIIFERIMYPRKIKNVEYILFSGIFMSVPYASAGFMGYSILNSSSTCAMFLSALTLLMINLNTEQKRKAPYLIGIVLTQFAFAIYQSHVNDFILGSCICILLYYIEKKINTIQELLTHIFRYVVVFIGGLFLYVVCDRVIVANLIEKSSYTDSFFAWGTEPIGDTIIKIVRGIGALFCSEDVPGYPYMLVGLVAYGITLLIVTIKQKTIKNKVIIFVLGLITIPCAYASSIALGGVLHWGTHSAVLLLMGFLWFFSLIYLRELINKKIVYSIVTVLAMIVLLRQIDIDNKIYYGGHLVSELDMELGYQLGTEIKRVVSDEGMKKPLVIAGKYRHNAPVVIECGMEARSLFLRAHNYKVWYLNYLGFPYKVASLPVYTEAFEIAKELPVWPEEGCIIETEECIIVHLSNLY